MDLIVLFSGFMFGLIALVWSVSDNVKHNQKIEDAIKTKKLIWYDKIYTIKED